MPARLGQAGGPCERPIVSDAPQTGRRPWIGITADVRQEGGGAARVSVSGAYAEAVWRAGGAPVVVHGLPGADPDAVAAGVLDGLDGVVLTGGADPDMRAFGLANHPAAELVHPARQAFDFALLRALGQKPGVPVLGVCLGMQQMGILRGAGLLQHLPDEFPATAAEHTGDRQHAVVPTDGARLGDGATLPAGVVTSWHHQALGDGGSLRVLARAHDGVIEAVDDPGRPFYLGVQWHPERTRDRALGDGLFARLVGACLAARGGRA
ncbi:MAG: hypothetical protein C0475_01505 [Planctomyces sp.]|nr:hypothetical protein [Planctomyces sp.]MBA4039740.1 hypothetical protein [Planctomyces sp.]MBA4119260.1 hypothetical protein [Isosphaera sp.]